MLINNSENILNEQHNCIHKDGLTITKSSIRKQLSISHDKKILNGF